MAYYSYEKEDETVVKRFFFKLVNHAADWLCDNDNALIYVFLFFVALIILQAILAIHYYEP